MVTSQQLRVSQTSPSSGYRLSHPSPALGHYSCGSRPTAKQTRRYIGVPAARPPTRSLLAAGLPWRPSAMLHRCPARATGACQVLALTMLRSDPRVAFRTGEGMPGHRWPCSHTGGCRSRHTRMSRPCKARGVDLRTRTRGCGWRQPGGRATRCAKITACTSRAAAAATRSTTGARWQAS